MSRRPYKVLIQISVENSYESWREAARKCLSDDIAPEDVLWTCGAGDSLFENSSANQNVGRVFKISPDFFPLAETVVCFDDAEKFALLYRILFRIVHENRNLLHIESDDDVRKARLMEKAVYRDVHKFHAFVRFRRVELAGAEVFVAWHEPHHYTVERAAPFFARRFGAMRFSILTPKGCAHWNLEDLRFSEAVAKQSLPNDDTEDFWLIYYRSIFNPFRLKIKAMKKELPVRHWKTLPEAVLIPELIRQGEAAEKKKRF
ncbi:MAG: TIGR03915 family putative DNA repair protein [Acidobacteriota bacterium]|nr:TIGR03915 family putative DNA repair protein [Acidobacteriota bacterium]